MAEFDAVIVGAGHNGLTCGSYLARAGLKVAILERRSVVGGAAVTEELWPGVQISRASYVPSLNESVIEDLELAKHGLTLGAVDPQNFAPFPDGRYLFTYLSDERCARGIEKFSKRDAIEFPKFSQYLRQFAEVVEPLMLASPPPLNDLLGFFEGQEIESLVRDILLTSCRDLLEERFESEQVKGALAMNGILNTSMGPDVIGTSYILALALGKRGYHYAVGGTGAVSRSLASYFTAHGGTILTEADVRRIVIKSGRAVGVELSSGREISGRTIVSNADPKRTFLKLVGPDHLEREFVHRIEKVRAFGTSFKINLVLSHPLDFHALPGTSIADQHRALTDVAPSIEFIQRAYDACKWGRLPEEPPLSIFCQTAWDPTVAPPGKHTLSIISKFNPYFLHEGSWADAKPVVVERSLDLLERYAPGTRVSIEHMDALSPLDLEEVFGLTEGNVTHLDQTLNQMLSFRPLSGWSQYRTPVEGLYLCGAGTHPGGGVKAAPGHNAAQVILEEMKLQPPPGR